MRILFLGNPLNQFMHNLAIELKRSNPRIQIEAISIPNYSDNYDKRIFQNVYNIHLSFSFLEKIPFLKIIYYYFGIKKILDKNNKYDVISIQMVYYYYFLAVSILKRKSKKLLLTFYGSDFNQLSPIYKPFLKRVVRSASKISTANPKLRYDLQHHFDLSESDISIVRFGLRPLDKLSSLIKQTTKSDAKKEIGFGNSFVITIGTNASQNQNHLEIINIISNVTELLPKDYLLVFPMTYGYGNRREYIDKIKSLLIKKKLNFKILDDFLSDQDIAILRISTDILIQLQNHDQLSGAMQEHLFAGNIVITGAWLDYNIMKQNNIFFLEINQISELEDLLPKLFEDTQVDFQKRNENSQKVWDLSSWSKTINNWLIFYGIKP